ncbi:MAG TPA: alginate lyase family protein, partial [Bryobacteraceae bacterium]|nr:alginate lyase family protein [Bryobacteraceae bacterium]
RRTKPYSYSLFNLEAMSAICQILSSAGDNLWTFRTPDGRGVENALAFMYPYIKDKGKWQYPPDVMYFDQWPVRESSLLFGGLALKRPDYIALWKTLNSDPTVEEVIRNFPIRQPVLWI